jgi:hypothetical protein
MPCGIRRKKKLGESKRVRVHGGTRTCHLEIRSATDTWPQAQRPLHSLVDKVDLRQREDESWV